MASFTTTASFLSTRGPTPAQRRLVVANAAAKSTEAANSTENKDQDAHNRRDLMFAAAASAMCSVAGITLADEPKRGSPQAMKVYAPICLTMPTARICHN